MMFSLSAERSTSDLTSLFKHSGHAAQLLETQVHGMRSRVQATHGSHTKSGRGRSLADKAEGRRRLSEVYAMPPHIPICVCTFIRNYYYSFLGSDAELCRALAKSDRKYILR